MNKRENAIVFSGFAVMAIAVVTLIIALVVIIPNQSHTITRQIRDDWPQVTRTVDGSPLVVQPEDLDR